MFYQERIQAIKEGDRVLEIGPGASPFHRSDIFLELKFEDEKEYEKQFGHADKLVTDKPVVFYDGGKFPFQDKEFDYVICSHVIEHVPNVEFFISEMFRISKMGYLEYPLVCYDYLYNFDVHLNFLKFENGVLKYMKKSETHLQEFKSVQKFFFALMQQGHFTDILQSLPEYFFEGFEWKSPFKIKTVTDLNSLTAFVQPVPKFSEADIGKAGVKKLSKELVKSLISKIKK